MTEQQRADLKNIYGLSDNIIADLDRADGNPSVKQLLLMKLTNINMFRPLKHINWFLPFHEPEIEALEEGGFRVLLWDALIYLEKIASSVEFQQRKDFRHEILEILNQITQFKISQGNFDNYRTSWFTLKILKYYPNEELSLEVLSQIKYWFSTKFDKTLLTSEVLQDLLPKFLTVNSTDSDISKAELILKCVLEVHVTEDLSRSKIIGKKSYHFTGDYHWINDFIDNTELLTIFAKKTTNKFVNFLVEQIRKQLIVDENKFSFEHEENTVLVSMNPQKNTVHVKVFLLPGTPLYNFFDEDKRVNEENELLGEFTADFSSKQNFIKSFNEQFFNIEKLKSAKEKFLSLAIETYYGFYERETYQSLYNGNERKPFHEPFDILNDFLKKVLVIKSNNIQNIESIKVLLKNLLYEDYLYFIKLALYILGRSSIDYSEIFWENIESEKVNDVIFEGMYFGGELKPFLNRLTNLSQDKIDLLDSYIQRGSSFKYKDEEHYKFSLVWKQRLYQALSHNEIFQKKYEELRVITQQDSVLTPAIGEITVRSVEDYEGTSPFTNEQIAQFSNTELVQIVNDLDKTGSKESTSDRNGIHNSFRNIINQDPNKILDDLMPFLQSPLLFITLILSRLYKLREEKKEFNAEKVVEFLHTYYFSVTWEKELNKESSYREDNHVNNLRYIFWIIKNILTDDSITLSDNDMEKIFTMFVDIFSKQELLYKGIPEFTTSNENENYHMRAINSKLGSIIEAFIFYIRKETLHISNKIEIKWSSKCKEIYEKLLNNNFYEAYNFVGVYSNYFAWFDKQWLYKFIERSESLYEQNINLWKSFINGYFWDRTFYTGIYPRMQKNYMLLLRTSINDNNHSIDGLIQQAVQAYLYEFDNLRTGLISHILKDMNSEHIKSMIQTLVEFKKFIIIDENSNDCLHKTHFRQRVKVLLLWRFMYRYFKSKSTITVEEKKIISGFCRLVEYLFEINESNQDWLYQIASNLEEDHYTFILIEVLDELKEKGDKNLSAKSIANIFVELLKKHNVDYEQDHIISILLFLNAFDNIYIKAKLGEILDKYRIRGNHSIADEFIKRKSALQ